MGRLTEAEEEALYQERLRKQAEAAKERNADREVEGETAEVLEHQADLADVNTSNRNLAGRAARFSRRRGPTGQGRKWLEELRASEAEK